jgi:hypothetical protein
MGHLYQQVVEAAHYLQAVGMSEDQLTLLHHRSKTGWTQTFKSLYYYWSVPRDPRPRTLDFANRVRFIAREHKAKNQSLDTLVERALSKWPVP